MEGVRDLVKRNKILLGMMMVGIIMIIVGSCQTQSIEIKRTSGIKDEINHAVERTGLKVDAIVTERAHEWDMDYYKVKIYLTDNNASENRIKRALENVEALDQSMKYQVPYIYEIHVGDKAYGLSSHDGEIYEKHS